MFIKKLVGVAASGIIALATASPAFAAVTITITGNGANSDPDVTVTANVTDALSQSNVGTISNTVSADTDTGDNRANDNTDGDVTVDSGNATAEVTIDNVGHLNSAILSSTGTADDITATVSGNGAGSAPDATLTRNTIRSRAQANSGTLVNSIPLLRARTGRNRANRNTGGTVSVESGTADASATLTNTGNENSLTE